MGSVVIVEKGSELKVGNGCKIRQSKIVVKGNYRINMEDNCIISHSSLAFYSINGLRESHIGTHTSFYGVQLQAYGSFKCGGWNIFEQKNNTPMLTVFNGSLDIGHHNRFMNRFWIRYHAKEMCIRDSAMSYNHLVAYVLQLEKLHVFYMYPKKCLHHSVLDQRDEIKQELYL